MNNNYQLINNEHSESIFFSKYFFLDIIISTNQPNIIIDNNISKDMSQLNTSNEYINNNFVNQNTNEIKNIPNRNEIQWFFHPQNNLIDTAMHQHIDISSIYYNNSTQSNSIDNNYIQSPQMIQRGVKRKIGWTKDQLNYAMELVSKGFGTREAARRADMPHSTLHDRIKNPRKHPRPGKPTVLTRSEEIIIVNFLINLIDSGYIINNTVLSNIVKGLLVDGRTNPFKSDGPHRHWFVGFNKRHPILDYYKKQKNQECKLHVTMDMINPFIKDLLHYNLSGTTDSVAQEIENENPLLNKTQIEETKTVDDDEEEEENTEEEKKKKVYNPLSVGWAVKDVADGNSIKDVSKRYNIPYATIRNHAKNPTMGCKRGPKTVIPEYEEKIIETVIEKYCRTGYKFSNDDIGKIVMKLVSRDGRNGLFKADGPHRHWFQGFLKRHPDIAIYKARNNNYGFPSELLDIIINEVLLEKERFLTDSEQVYDESQIYENNV